MEPSQLRVIPTKSNEDQWSYSRPEKQSSIEQFQGQAAFVKARKNVGQIDICGSEPFQQRFESHLAARPSQLSIQSTTSSKSPAVSHTTFGALQHRNPSNQPPIISQQQSSSQYYDIDHSSVQAHNYLNLQHLSSQNNNDIKGVMKRRNDSFDISPNHSANGCSSSPGPQITRIKQSAFQQQLQQNHHQQAQLPLQQVPSIASYPIQPTFAQQLRIEKERKNRATEQQTIGIDLQIKQSTGSNVLPGQSNLDQQLQLSNLQNTDQNSITRNSNCNSGASLKKSSIKTTTTTNSNSNYTGSTTHSSAQYTPFSTDTTAIYHPLRDEYSPYSNNSFIPQGSTSIKHSRRPSNPLALLPSDGRAFTTSELANPISSDTIKNQQQQQQIASDNPKPLQSSSPLDFGAQQKYFTLQYNNNNTATNLFHDQTSLLSKISNNYSQQLSSKIYSDNSDQNGLQNNINLQSWLTMNNNPSADQIKAPSSTKSGHSTATKSRTSSMHFITSTQPILDGLQSQQKPIKLEDVYQQTQSQNSSQKGTQTIKSTTITLPKPLKQGGESNFFTTNNKQADLAVIDKFKQQLQSSAQPSQPSSFTSQQKIDSKKQVVQQQTTQQDKQVWYLHDSQAEHLDSDKLGYSTSTNLTMVTQTFRDDECSHQTARSNTSLVAPQNHARKNSQAVLLPSYYSDFEDLAQYFNANNGIRPSNNTPVVLQQAIESSKPLPQVAAFDETSIPFSHIQSFQLEKQDMPLETSINLFIEQEKLLIEPKQPNNDFTIIKPEFSSQLIDSVVEMMIEGQDEDHIIDLDEDPLNMADLLCDEENIREADDVLPHDNTAALTTFLKGINQEDDPNRAFDSNYLKAPAYTNLEQFETLPSYSNTTSAVKNYGEIGTLANDVSNFGIDKQKNAKAPIEDMKALLEDFEKNHIQHPIFGSDNLEFLVMQDSEYAPDPHYLSSSKQPNLSRNMRATLLDWMMEVSEEFRLKRETFHIAVNLVDRYLSLKHNIRKRDFQLVGVTSLYIAAKLEEIFPPRINDFVCSTNNGYTILEINQAELTILDTLKFKINPPTLNMWSNWFMSQWDIFVQTSDVAQENELIQEYVSNYERLIQFKQPDEDSYALFREFMQIVDITMLDISTLQHEPRQILASIMYIVLGRALNLFDDDFVHSISLQGIGEFYYDIEFNQLFDAFVNLSFGFPLQTIQPIIKIMAFYFALPKDTHIPSAASHQDSESPFQGYYEDFLAFQTHNKDQLSILQGRL